MFIIISTILNYDKSNKENSIRGTGYTSPIQNIIKGFKKDIPMLSKEVQELFNSFDDGGQFNILLEDMYDSKSFKDKTFNSWINSLDESEKEVLTAGEALDKYKTHLDQTTKSTSTFSKAMSKLGTIGKTALSFAGNVAVMMLVSKGIETAITKWDDYSHVQEKAIEKGDATLNKHKDNLKQFSESSKLIDNVGERFEELHKGVSSLGENKGLTTEEFEEYQNIVSQLATSMPSLVDGYDALGNPIINTTTNVKELTAALQEQQQIISQSNVANAKDYVSAFNSKVNQEATDFTKESGLLQQREGLQKLAEGINNGENIANYFGSNLENTISKVPGFIDKLSDIFGTNSGTFENMNAVTDSWSKDNLLFQDIAEAAGISDKTIELAKQELDNASKNDAVKIQEARDYINEKTLAQLKENESQLNSAFTDVKPLIESTLTDNKNNKAYNSLRDTTKNAVGSILDTMTFADGQALGFITDSGNLDETAIQKWGNNIVRNLKNTNVQDEISELFSLHDNIDNMSYKDYVDNAEKLIGTLSAKVPELSSDVLKSTTGIDKALSDLAQKRTDLMNDGLNESFINSLSNSDMEILWDLNADGVIKNASQAKKAIEDFKNSMESNEPDKYFNAWQKATETANGGNKYDTMLAGYESALEAYKDGEVGTDDFKTFAAMISPTGSDDARNFAENYPKFERYFTEGRKGIDKFINDISGVVNTTGQKFAEFNDDTGRWDFNVTNLDDVAQKLGISSEMVGAAFGKMRDYGIDNNIITSVEDGATRTGDLIADLQAENKRLARLTTNTGENEQGYHTDAGEHTFGNQTAIDESRAKIQQYNEDIAETTDNTKALIRTQNEGFESQQKAAIAAAKTLNEQKKAAEDAGLQDTANAIQEQINSLGKDFDIPDITAKVNFDIEKATQDVNGIFDSAWNTLNATGKASAGSFEELSSRIKEIKESDGDISALTQRFNDLATASKSAFRMDESGNTFNISDRIKEIESLAEEVSKVSQSGGDASVSLSQMATGIHALASSGTDISGLADSYNRLAETTGSEFRMDITGELVSVETYNGEPPEVEVKGKVTVDNSEMVDSVSEKLQEFYGNDMYANIEFVTNDTEFMDVVNQIHELTNSNTKVAVQFGLAGNESIEQIASGIIDGTVKIPAEYEIVNNNTTESIEPVEIPAEIKELVSPKVEPKPIEIPVNVEEPEIPKIDNQSYTVDAIEGTTVEPRTGKTITDEVIEEKTVEVPPRDGKIITDQVVEEKVNEVPVTDEQKTVTVNEQLGNTVESVPDAQGTANFLLGLYPTSVPTAWGTANYRLGSYPTFLPPITQTIIANKVGFASGTMLSPARVDGTAYNTINTKPISAYANGKVSLPKDEVALSNEVGQESIIRAGKWMLLPPGMHMQSFKKGDIILNAKQTADLLRSGKASGHGKAYADGTMPHVRNLVSNAYAGGTVISNAYANGTNSDKEPTKYDWVETKLERIARSLSNLERDAKEFQNTYSAQNTSLTKAILQAQSNMKTMQNAYSYYMNKANSIDFGSAGRQYNIKDKIMNGVIYIDEFADEDLNKKIEEFKKLYENALDLKDEIEELKIKIKELNLQKLDNITKSFDSAAEYYNSLADIYQNTIDLAEAQGKVGNESDYKNIIGQKDNERATLRAQYLMLQKELNRLIKDGTVKKNTNDWYEWQTKIEDVRGEIISLDKDVIELRQNILEVRWDSFEKVTTKIDNLKESLSSVGDLIDETMSFVDDTSQFSDMGFAKIGLLQQELIQAKQAVVNYNMALETLEKEYKNGFYSQEQYAEKLSELQKSQLDYVSDIKKTKDAILSLVKEGINRETDAMEELISKRKEAIQQQKDEYNWSKKVTDHNKERNKILAQLAAMEGDDSKETVAKRRKLQEQLQNLEDDFDEERRDHEYDSRSKAYDDQLEKFKELQEKQLNLLESSLEAQNAVIENILGSVYENHDSAYDALQKLGENYGFNLSSQLTGPFADAMAALEAYKQAMGELKADVSINTGNLPDTNKDKVQNASNDWYSNYEVRSAGGQWKKNGNNWNFQYANGKNATNEWVLDPNNNKWYHMDSKGNMQTGWQKVNDKWYYMNSGGDMASGWKKVNDKWYYLGEANDGSMKTGWQKVNSKWYYMDAKSGSMKTGWQKVDGKYYYMDKSGAMAANTYVYDAKAQKAYWVNGSGVWDSGKDQNYYGTASGTATEIGNAATIGKVSSIGGNLSHGMVNENVGKLQQALKALGYYKGNLDNSFGDQTYDAVKQFQRDNGISADGIVGKDTKAKFKAKGYASGTKSATAGVHQVWENGEELFMDSEGNKFRIFKNNDVVFDHNQTERLWDISKGLEPQPILPNIKSNFSQIVPTQKVGGDVNVKIDSLVGNIEYVDKNALPDLNTILKKSADYTRTYMVKELGKLGWK